MSALAYAISDATVAAAAALSDRMLTCDAPDDPPWRGLRERLGWLARLDQRPFAAAFARGVQRAASRLRQEEDDREAAGQALALLGAAGPGAEQFRQIAIEELLLSARPNLGRLLDFYRRHWRPQATGSPLPPWPAIEPALRRFLSGLLPEALAQQPALRRCLPADDERALIGRLLAAGIASPQQAIVARDGAVISQVQQTIVHGDLYALPPPLVDLEGLYRRYCTFLVEMFASIDFRGMLQIRHATRLPLESIYVPPGGRLDGRRTALSELPGGLPSAVRPLHEIVRDTPFLVVLGHPGSGKSTLVRAILLALARGEGPRRLGLTTAWLPIFFPVAAFAAARAQPGRHDLAPLEYLGAYYAGLSQPDYGPLFARALERGHALVLLDGLDEVRDDRLRLTRCLEAFVREWDGPGNRFVATSRIAGYDDAPLDEALFARAAIQPFADDEIRQFVARWSWAYECAGEPGGRDGGTTAGELQRRADEHSRQLEAAIFATPRVTDLARTPLLLTILALIHNQGAQLPDRRVDLYRLCVEALAETWNRARSLSGREIDVYLGVEKISERLVVNLLGPAALWIHGDQPGGLVEQRDLERQLATTLAQADGLPQGQAMRLALAFIELMRRDTGLLQERGYRRFGFLHLTFEEYLAARALLESVTVADLDARLHVYACDPRWREVIRLALAAAPQREAQRLLLHLLRAPTTPEQRGQPTVLAGECLLDIGRGSATRRAWEAVVAALVELLEDPAVPLATRVAGGEVLGRLGDPRLLDLAHQRHPAPPGYWCAIAAGPFWSGDDSRPGAKAALRQATLAADIQIARYPVTNGEFRRFVAAGGYRERRWWTEAGWAFLQPGGHPSPLDNAELPITQPGLWENTQFNNPSQPVVGVSWYEAAAYCAWLAEQGRRAGWLGACEVLRLPTDLEWERAARHTDRRRYPWGDEPPDAGRANYEATGLRAPAPVGCFPAGAAACGALDMAGNVWEWTATLWGSEDDPRPRRDVGLAEMPVIRGGAFNWEATYLACGSRYWFNPGHRYNLLGFRIVRAAAT